MSYDKFDQEFVTRLFEDRQTFRVTLYVVRQCFLVWLGLNCYSDTWGWKHLSETKGEGGKEPRIKERIALGFAKCVSGTSRDP